MRIAEFVTEISRRGFLKGAAATAAAGSVAAPFVYNKLKGSEHPEPAPTPQQPAPKLGLVLKSPAEKYLHDYAISKGINGIELAAFMAQCSHESQGFTKFVENGVVSYFRKYDIRYNRKNALGIGNTKPGDGYLYRGRGYIHLTGRDNYRIFGKKIGQPLEEQPELAADPKIAAQIAVEYWKSRVQGRVTDFTDIKAVTKPINKNLEGLIDRTRRFKEYMKSLG
jgi:putative chitinase